MKTRSHLLLILFFLTCFYACKDDGEVIENYEKGVINGEVNKTSILAGDSITFTDFSTKVYTRTWAFPGGNPASSSDSVVKVTYVNGGLFIASLTIRFIDNQIKILEFPIQVEGDLNENLGFYTETTGVKSSVEVIFRNNHAFTITDVNTGVCEGAVSKSYAFDGSDTWAMGSIAPMNGTVNFTDYMDGYYNIAIKTSSEGAFYIRLQSTGQQAKILFDTGEEKYGLQRDGNWHLVSIPIDDFTDNNPYLDLTKITELFVLRSEGNVKLYNNYDFVFDDFYLSKTKPD